MNDDTLDLDEIRHQIITSTTETWVANMGGYRNVLALLDRCEKAEAELATLRAQVAECVAWCRGSNYGIAFELWRAADHLTELTGIGETK